MLLLVNFILWLAFTVIVPTTLEGPVYAASQQGVGPEKQALRTLDEGRLPPVFGKITAIHEGSIEVEKPEGNSVTVKITPKTEFRKDRQAAKLADFKVGDTIIVRGQESQDHTWTAEAVAGRSGMGRDGGPGGPMGTLGKDYVVGEVTSVDAPRLSVLRPDNVTQTLEPNEETSLRRGRDSITMADVQVGDHVFARGAAQNDVFVPKMIMVVDPAQWKRMQEMQGPRWPAPGAPDKSSRSQNPPEPRN